MSVVTRSNVLLSMCDQPKISFNSDMRQNVAENSIGIIDKAGKYADTHAGRYRPMLRFDAREPDAGSVLAALHRARSVRSR